ncbi:protein of unknown function [Methylocaldum szegediense]|uniref:Uncharacterized protein n=1 Tax=Methylocaldum szegediense TaxID=73780 RepID=A0ABN8XB92_9GAMM|nr:protein of unknown function [Methylocaldum szegediense]
MWRIPITMAMPMGTATGITITTTITTMGITKENTTIGIAGIVIDAFLRMYSPLMCLQANRVSSSR